MIARANLLFGRDTENKEAFLANILESLKPSLVHTYGEEKPLGIDLVHEIHRQASLTGHTAFIIRRADHMTREAGEAFLKLLEEVPASSYFFLIADSSNMPETLLSRLSKFPFFPSREEQTETSGLETEIIKLRNTLVENTKNSGSVPKNTFAALSRAVNISALFSSSQIPVHYKEELYGSSTSAS